METSLTKNSLFRFLTVVLIPLALVLLVTFRLNGYYQIVFVLFFVNVILAAALTLPTASRASSPWGRRGSWGWGPTSAPFSPWTRS